MDNFKRILFEDCLYYGRKYESFKKENGEWDHMTDVARIRYSTLYSFIQDTGLENEYLEWRAQQGGEQHENPDH